MNPQDFFGQSPPSDPSPVRENELYEKVPWNWRTKVFAAMMAVLWSTAVYVFMPERFHFDEVESGALGIVLGIVIYLSCFGLPLWSVFALRPYPSLKVLGLITFYAYIIIMASLPLRVR